MNRREAAAPTPRQLSRQIRRERLTGSRRIAREGEWFRRLAETRSQEEAHAEFLRLKLYDVQERRRSRFWAWVGRAGALIGLVAGVLGIYQWWVPELTTIRVTGIDLPGGGPAPMAIGRIDGDLSLELWVDGRLVRRYGPAEEAEIYGAQAAEVPYRRRGFDLRFRLVHYSNGDGRPPAEYGGDPLHFRGYGNSEFPLTLADPAGFGGLGPPSPLDAVVHFTVESR